MGSTLPADGLHGHSGLEVGTMTLAWSGHGRSLLSVDIVPSVLNLATCPGFGVHFKERFDGDLEVVKKKKRAKGFHVLPRRWVVERTFAWLGRSRRLSKDYERNPLSSESQVYCASARLLLRQITDNQIQYKLSNCEFSA